jgi:trehalose/maltose hydrolase-like predicted phosphorylase
VQAGRRGRFGLVVGVDRGASRTALATAGADAVVSDLAEVDPERLAALFRARQEQMAWQVEAEGFDPAREHSVESLFAVGNGYLGMREALPLPSSWGDLFIAGIYDRKDEELAYSELEFLAPERRGNPHVQLVPLPFPLQIAARVEGEQLVFSTKRGRGPEPGWRDLRRRLDLRRAVFEGEALHETAGGRRTRLRTLRCASLADPHVVLQEVVATPENHWGTSRARRLPPEPGEMDRHPPLARPRAH